MMPTSITKPMRDTTLSSTPAISRMIKPPVKARGIVNMTMNGDFSDWNCATITRYTSRMPSASISSSWLMASMMVSFSPSNSAVTPSGSASASTAFMAAADTLVTLYPSATVAVAVMQRRCSMRLMVFMLTVRSTVATSPSRKLSPEPDAAVEPPVEPIELAEKPIDPPIE